MPIDHNTPDPDREDYLNIPIEKCVNVPVKQLELIRRLGIDRVYDLISFFPKDYEDWSNPKYISELCDQTVSAFSAIVRQSPSLYRKGRISVLQTVLSDESGMIRAIWFNQPYYRSKLIKGQSYLFRGKIKRDGRVFEVINPLFREGGSEDIPLVRGIYPMTRGLTQNRIRSMIEKILPRALMELPEPIPPSILRSEHLCSAPYAYEKIHFPDSPRALEEAKKRLVFEELFLILGGLRAMKRKKSSSGKAVVNKPDKGATERLQRFMELFPFRFTPDQIKVCGEISEDLSSARPMNRLIQGDVGSGKTAVAAYAMCLCAACGNQSVFMAPTSVLASQHFANLEALFRTVGIGVELMLGSTPDKEKRLIRERLADGRSQVLIGTHAVLSEKNEYRSLALLITDEQHRFGVRQRGALTESGSKDIHTLVMSATPIPRTLAMILYGDLDISVIASVPSGRIPVETYLATASENDRIYGIMKRQMDAGRQVYYVCPQIDSEDSDETFIATVTEQYDLFRKSVFPSYRVSLLHGGMPTDEKDRVMRSFSDGLTDLLVSTTVIEVGVDNPNASLMVIENAERFGLATLHQLRGRIGRGPHRSVCILKTDKTDESVIKRLKTVCKITDGFLLAEKDLELRGPGDFFGTRQHGLPTLRIANLYRDAGLLSRISEYVDELLVKDENQPGEQSVKLFDAFCRRFGAEMDKAPL
ncbi:MAG: ATP-dependent DNA helicase RecG [Clostridiaceae bacterium]|nr:ATP-dependent DNA helicase RecG [Clostridiaceae bacterium]